MKIFGYSLATVALFVAFFVLGTKYPNTFAALHNKMGG